MLNIAKKEFYEITMLIVLPNFAISVRRLHEMPIIIVNEVFSSVVFSVFNPKKRKSDGLIVIGLRVNIIVFKLIDDSLTVLGLVGRRYEIHLSLRLYSP